MSKNPPTLADECVATLLDKTMAGGMQPQNAPIRALYTKILNARKFVLDNNMSAYLADLSRSFYRGGQRKRIRLLENARRMARLPHALTWIEFSHADYMERLTTEYGVAIKTLDGKPLGRGQIVDGYQIVPRIGYLIQQHPKIDTAFVATEFYTSMVRAHRGMFKVISTAWCSDDSPSPFRRLDCFGEHDAELIVEILGYRSPYTHFVSTVSDDDTRACVRDGKLFMFSKSGTPARDLWALLATINDLPIVFERVEPSKGYMSRGSYKKFLKHTVLHLTVPETRWRKLVGKTAAALRRRAHQVRGHWRKDWRSPLASLCEHDFDDHMKCRRCSGHKIWIAEHQRGDASIGFVTHDYEIHHE